MNRLAPMVFFAFQFPYSVVRHARSQRMKRWLQRLLGLGLVPVALQAGVALGADRVTISYGLLERSIRISSLDTYAKEGKVERDLRVYLQYLDDAQEAELRRLLQSQVDLSAVAVSQFLYTDQGEILLRRLGEVVRTDSNLSGFYAIRAALILAAADPRGLSPLNVLEQFPLSNIRIDLSRTLEILGELETLIRQTQTAVSLVEQQAIQEADANLVSNFLVLPRLDVPGSISWQKLTIQLQDQSRDRSFPADIYLPQIQTAANSMPVVLISHGLGSDRTSYAYLAKQLASYGIAVAVPEHPGSNAEQLQALISGVASEVTASSEFIDRPLDMKYLLDRLEVLNQSDPRFQGRLNLKQVGVVGQSFGGYTALALAGASINFRQLSNDCINDTLNLSLLLQCRALDLQQPTPRLKDDRVKAIIAINPIGSSLLGKVDFAAIQIPVMLVSSSADTVAPALLEQIRPFTWLETAKKYLVVLQGGTHFSTIGVSPGADDEIIALPSEVVGPDPTLAQNYLKSIGVAFFQTYIADRPEYRSYLDAAQIERMSKSVLPISLVKSLTPSQLAEALGERSVEAASSQTSHLPPNADNPNE